MERFWQYRSADRGRDRCRGGRAGRGSCYGDRPLRPAGTHDSGAAKGHQHHPHERRHSAEGAGEITVSHS